MKILEEVIPKNDFLWYGVAKFSQNYLKQTPKNEEIIESIQLLSNKVISLKLVNKGNI